MTVPERINIVGWLSADLEKFRESSELTELEFAQCIGWPLATYRLLKGNHSGNGPYHTNKPQNRNLWLLVTNHMLPKEIRRLAKAIIVYGRLWRMRKLKLLRDLPRWVPPPANDNEFRVRRNRRQPR